MNKNNKSMDPPKWSLKILKTFIKKDYLEEIEGDMEEIFYDDLTHYSISKSRRRYNWQVLKLLRPAVMKNFEGTHDLNYYGMLKNYFKTSLRTLKKNPLFSGINIVGLAISMSVGILMILLLSELYSFDQFHEKKDSIYRITSTSKVHDIDVKGPTASMFIGDQVVEKITGIKEMLIMRPGMSANIKTANGAITLTGHYTSPSFFDVFSFQLLKGNPKTALAEPNGIVLTESSASKIFGDIDPIGQPLPLESTGGYQKRTIDGVVTGVVQDPPSNSHLQFESLIALDTYKQPAAGSGWREDFRTDPKDFQYNFVYLLLDGGTEPADVEETIQNLMTDYNANINNPITHQLQPLSDFVTSDSFNNRAGPSFSSRKLYIMLGLTLIVLLSACFNYTNLSLARSLRRSKEVGVRKVTGASGFQVFFQFIIEAVILSLVALVVGIGLFYLIRPEFLQLPNPAARGYKMFLLEINYEQLLYFLLFAIIIGVVAGFLPAFFLSKLKARTVFNDASKIKPFSGISLRNMLTVFQFAMSIGLITCAVLVHQQYKYAINYDLGYVTEEIVNINVTGDYAVLLENEYARIPEVQGTSKSSVVLGVGSVQMMMVQSEDKSNRSMCLVNTVDEKYHEMHQFDMLAGTGFVASLKEGETPKHIVVNEAFLKAINLGTPQEAIGQNIWQNDTKLQIVGVVGEFINIALNINIQDAFAFIQTSSSKDYSTLAVKIQSNDLYETISKLEERYEKLDPVHPFEAKFYDDSIARMYEPQKTTLTMISFLAFLAISISTLGLLGMAVFTTETRTKEISIRKILGASINHLMLLLSRSFIFMIVLAAILAIPLTIYIVDTLILNEFTYRAEAGLIEILSGFILVVTIGFFTIGWQIRQAALKNPTDTLKVE